MTIRIAPVVTWLAIVALTGVPALADEELKRAVEASLDRQSDALIGLADVIWNYAEVALEEIQSSKALAEYARSQGFQVVRGVGGMPTAFVAEYGNGKPIIGILGEYDALPGISQKAVPRQEPAERGGAGHGCGHNLFGPASLGAAVAIKELIDVGKLKGTIRFYGCPAEESVGGKLYMARDGLFDDLDVCLAWHPSDKTKADVTSSQAMVDFTVEFHGRTAHAAADPWNGRSAVDGAELFTDGVNMLREHVKPSVRIHYTIVNGGDVPNVVPAYAKVWCWVRDWQRDGVEDVMTRVREIAEGAALMAGVRSELKVTTGDYEMLVNRAGAELLDANLRRLGPIEFTDQEIDFAKQIQRATDVDQKGLSVEIVALDKQKREGGSSDVADVSWIVPMLHVSVTTAPADAPWHAWPVVSCSGMSIGHKGMLHAGKALSTTMVDLYTRPDQLKQIREEFARQTDGQKYKGYIPDGPPPLPR